MGDHSPSPRNTSKTYAERRPRAPGSVPAKLAAVVHACVSHDGPMGSTPVPLSSSNCLLLPHSFHCPGTPILFLFPTFLATPTDKSQLSMNSKLGMASWGLPWLIYPPFAQCLMVYLRRGEGGPPSSSPSPSQSIMGPPFHWPLPSHGTL